MELTVRNLERIPRENLRVHVAEFARLWLTAERRGDALNDQGEVDWYLAGVQITCRWLAQALVPKDGKAGQEREWAWAPITSTTEWAIQERIEAEAVAADRWIGREWPNCPGYVEGVVATLAWAWRRSGVPPIDVAQRTRA